MSPAETVSETAAMANSFFSEETVSTFSVAMAAVLGAAC
jgi:hypothetical protein